MTAAELIAELRSRANPANVAGMARFGINPKGTLGVGMVEIRRLARRAGLSHEVAGELWASGIHEARVLATIVEDPALVTRRQMDGWAHDFDSWDVCDQACQNLFWKTAHAWDRAERWSRARSEFVRRAGFSLVASLARKRKEAGDGEFEEALGWIAAAATDERNFVRKAANWALREIGKRNARLRASAIRAAEEMRAMDSRAAKWIASDALRELRR